MVAIFSLHSLLVVGVLFVCTVTYVRDLRPSLFQRKQTGFLDFFRKAAVVGTRLSPWVSAACLLLAVLNLF